MFVLSSLSQRHTSLSLLLHFCKHTFILKHAHLLMHLLSCPYLFMFIFSQRLQAALTISTRKRPLPPPQTSHRDIAIILVRSCPLRCCTRDSPVPRCRCIWMTASGNFFRIRRRRMWPTRTYPPILGTNASRYALYLRALLTHAARTCFLCDTHSFAHFL